MTYFVYRRGNPEFENNRRVFERLCDYAGENVLLLGSKSGQFTGQLEDCALLPFKATGIRILIIGQKGDGKSWLQASLFQQLNAFYNYPILLNDLKNEFLDLSKPIRNRNALISMRKLGLQPMCFNNLRVVVPAPNWSSRYESLPQTNRWKLEFKDLFTIESVFDRKSFLYSMLGVEGDSQSDEKKWEAAHTYIDTVMVEHGDEIETFEGFLDAINDEFDKLVKRSGKKGEQALSPALLRQINETVARSNAYGGKAFDFLTHINQREILSLQGSVGIGMRDRVQQAYFCFPYFLVKQWRELNAVDKVCNIYEERDAIVRSNDKSLVARLSELNATKGRTLSNIDIFTIQDVGNVDNTEVQQFDYIFTTRPNDSKVYDVLRAKNNNEEMLNAARGLRKTSPPHEWIWVSASDFGTFTPISPFAQPTEENAEYRLVGGQGNLLSGNAEHAHVFWHKSM